MSQPGPEVQRLGALVARWRTDGHIIADPPVPIAGSDVYEWLPGGFFLVHHVDVVVGEQAVQALEMIGDLDRATDSFTAHAYDDQGNITILHAKVDDRGVWTFTGGRDIATEAQSDAEETAAAIDAHSGRRAQPNERALGAQRRRICVGAVDGRELHQDAGARRLRPMKGSSRRVSFRHEV